MALNDSYQQKAYAGLVAAASTSRNVGWMQNVRILLSFSAIASYSVCVLASNSKCGGALAVWYIQVVTRMGAVRCIGG